MLCPPPAWGLPAAFLTRVSNHRRKLPVFPPAPHVWSSPSSIMAMPSSICSRYMQPWCRSTLDSSRSRIASRWSVTYTQTPASSHPHRPCLGAGVISCLHYYDGSLCPSCLCPCPSTISPQNSLGASLKWKPEHQTSLLQPPTPTGSHPIQNSLTMVCGVHEIQLCCPHHVLVLSIEHIPLYPPARSSRRLPGSSALGFYTCGLLLALTTWPLTSSSSLL